MTRAEKKKRLKAWKENQDWSGTTDAAWAEKPEE